MVGRPSVINTQFQEKMPLWALRFFGNQHACALFKWAFSDFFVKYTAHSFIYRNIAITK